MQSKTGGKSAGRVQSVALKLIVDREDEINKLREENLSKDKDIILCQSMLCKKMCCKTRKPIVGLGEKFFNDLKAGKEKLDYENQ